MTGRPWPRTTISILGVPEDRGRVEGLAGVRGVLTYSGDVPPVYELRFADDASWTIRGRLEAAGVAAESWHKRSII